MPDIIHRIGIKAPEAKVYEAVSTINGIANWWTDDVKGDSSVGGKILFTFKSKSGDVIGEMTMQVLELNAGKSVKWRCIDGPQEWIGTDITFDLDKQDDQVILLFGHRNWKQAVEFTAHCSMKWAVFLLSLRDFVETGKGKPSPNDLKIDNWN